MVPKPPTQTLDIIHLAWSRDASVHELGKRIQAAPELGAIVLGFVNSQHMELGREVAHAARAVLLLGAKAAGTLAIARAWTEVMEQAPIDPDIKQALVEDCVRRASLACALARRFPNVSPEQAFVVGLMTETGRLLPILRDPANGIWMDNIRCLTGQTRLQKEREFLESTHVEDLAKLCTAWGLPKDLVTPLIEHHEPEDPSELRPHRVRQIARWADLMAEVVTANDSAGAWATARQALMSEARFSAEVAAEVLAIGLAATQDTGRIVGFDVPEQPSVGALLSGEDEDPSGMGRDALLRMVQQGKRERLLLKKQLDEIKLRLQAMQASDTLTGIPARARYFQVLRKEVERAEETGLAATVVHVDIDNLEQHNLRYGHDAGDAIVKKVAEMLARMTREADFVARIGGDEFALVMPRTNPSGGRIIAERIRAAIETLRLSVDSGQVRVSATVVGLCMDEAPGLNSEQLHNKAAAELDRVKGANRVAWAA